MPELPEVETIRLGLEKKLPGLIIKKVNLVTPKSFQGDPKNIENKTITGIWRKAKVLGIELNDHQTIMIHLKMTGQLIYEGNKRFIGGHPTPDMTLELPNKSTRVIFEFSDQSKLFFNDQRRFGWVKIMDNDKLKEDSLLSKLGPEPLNENFTWQILKQNLLKHKQSLRTNVLRTQAIKVALLDQSVVSGIGNIYASEACFNAKIDPKTKVSNLTNQQFQDLHAGVIQALKDGIKYGGSTKTHFVDSDGKKGYFLDYAFVYAREKKPCKNCGTKIEKFQLGGRGTYFCPSCQK